MKTLHKILVVAALALSMVARAGIIGSPHDFSQQSWNNNAGDQHTVCGVCHTPHHADPVLGPLWNHTSSGLGFTMYANGTAPAANVKFIPAAQPNASSLACLSCHDGTVAVNSYGVNDIQGIQGGSAMMITNSANLTKDLTHTHPISFTYDTALCSLDQWLFNPDTTFVTPPASGGGAFVATIPNMSINIFLLNGNHTVECSSCHDVHNQIGSPYDINNNPHLVKIVGVDAQNEGSLLCRSCHNK
jgi:hypothetical protein